MSAKNDRMQQRFERFDQEIGLEILRRTNDYRKLVKALHEIAKHTDFCAIGSEARKANELARAALKDTEVA